VQAVIAAPPWLTETLFALEDGGVYAPRLQSRRSRQPCGTSTDDDDIVHPTKAMATTTGRTGRRHAGF
jgi:hypothetical protein